MPEPARGEPVCDSPAPLELREALLPRTKPSSFRGTEEGRMVRRGEGTLLPNELLGSPASQGEARPPVGGVVAYGTDEGDKEPSELLRKWRTGERRAA